MSMQLPRPVRFKDLSVENWNLAKATMTDHVHNKQDKRENMVDIVGFIDKSYMYVLTLKNHVYIKSIYKYDTTERLLTKVVELQI